MTAGAMRTLRTNPEWTYFAWVDENGDWRQAPPDTVIEVPEEAAERGLLTGGLMEVTATDVSPTIPVVEPATPPAGGGQVAAGDEYEDLKADALKALLSGRGLPISGTNAERVARLRAADAEAAGGSSGGE